MDFRSLLPFEAACAQTWSDLPETLHPSEEHLISGASSTRRAEFTSVRACARIALGQLGYDRPPLVALDGKGPEWPRGVAGSLTHTRGYCAAVASTAVRCIGIDAEQAGRLTNRAAERILSSRERLLKDTVDLTVLFSAKESAYKTWSSLGHEPLLPHECEVLLTDDHGLIIEIETPSAAATLDGSWSVEKQLVRTAVWSA